MEHGHFASEEGYAHLTRYLGRSSRTQVSTRPITPTPICATVLPAVRPTTISTPPRTQRKHRCVMSFMDPKTLETTFKYQQPI